MEIRALKSSFNKHGKIEWIGLRPERRADLIEVAQAQIATEEGLVDDHYSGKSKKRQVTLIQSEHLSVVAQLLEKNQIDPLLTRRNIVVSGINLLAAKNAQIQIGEKVVLEYTGPCDPCSRMEENLGKGGFNAMRGHGGICTKVVQGGNIRKGDIVRVIVKG